MDPIMPDSGGGGISFKLPQYGIWILIGTSILLLGALGVTSGLLLAPEPVRVITKDENKSIYRIGSHQFEENKIESFIDEKSFESMATTIPHVQTKRIDADSETGSIDISGIIISPGERISLREAIQARNQIINSAEKAFTIQADSKSDATLQVNTLSNNVYVHELHLPTTYQHILATTNGKVHTIDIGTGIEYNHNILHATSLQNSVNRNTTDIADIWTHKNTANYFPTLDGSGLLRTNQLPLIVLSVAGKTGTVTLNTDDVSESKNNLYYTDVRSRTALSITGSNLIYDSGTGVFSFTATPSFTDVTGTLITAAQPNITSLGTLAALQVDSLNLNGSNLTFAGATGDNTITVQDDLASTLLITDGTQNYIQLVSTTGADEVKLLQNTSVAGTLNCDTLFTIDAVSIDAAALEFANDLDQQLAIGSSPSFSNITGTLNTAAQPNITSLGTLTALQVDSDLTFSGATGDNKITVPDNLASALLLTDGTQNYIQLVSTTGADEVKLLQNTSVTGTLTVTGDITVTGTTTLDTTLSGVLKATAGVVTGNATTDDVTEGTNLYYTDVRSRAALSVPPGSNLLYDSGTGEFSITSNPTFSSLIIGGSTALSPSLNGLLTTSSGVVSNATIGTGLEYTAGQLHATTLQTSVNTNTADIADILTNKDTANYFPTLDGSGLLRTNQFPLIAISEIFTVATPAAQISLTESQTAQKGDIAVRTDENKSYVHNGGSAGDMTDWTLLLTPTDAVLSVAGKTGSVTLNTDDVSESKNNLYYTDVRSRAALSSAGSNLSYDSGTGEFSFSATPSFTDVTGTLITAAQPNITSLGTLTTLQVDSDLTYVGATGDNKITVPDNLASALLLTDGTQNYIQLVSTTGADEVQLLQNTSVTGTLTVTGDITVTGTTTLNEALGGVLKATAGVVTGNATTDDVTEGTNWYYTDVRSRAALSSADSNLSYNSGTGEFSFSATPSFTDVTVTGTTTLDTTLNGLLTTSSGVVSNATIGTGLEYTAGQLHATALQTSVNTNVADIADIWTNKDTANYFPTLDGSGLLRTNQFPPLAISEIFTVANETAQLAQTAQKGDIAVRTDENKSYVHNGGSAGDITDWTLLLTPTGAVLSVAGKTGTVTLNTDDVSESANLYYTDVRSRAALSVPPGSNLIYDSGTGEFSFSATPSFTDVTVTGTTTLDTALGGVLKATAGVVSGSATTSDLSEGSNLYYTDVRSRTALSVPPGSNLIYDSGTGEFSFSATPSFTDVTVTGTTTLDTALGGVLKATAGVVSGSATTSDLSEGSNLYYTDARVSASTLNTQVQNIQTELDAHDDGLKNLTASEITQLTNIDTHTISNTKWGYVAAMQAVSTADNVTFNNITMNGTLFKKNTFEIADNGHTSFQRVRIHSGSSSSYIFGGIIDNGLHLVYNAYKPYDTDWDKGSPGQAPSRITLGDGTIKFYTNTTYTEPTIERMSMDSSGNVNMTASLTVGGDISINDNKKVILGAGSNASIYYDGTNLQINPQVVGSGVTAFTGNIETNGTLSCDTSLTIDAVSIGATALDYCNDINQQLTSTSSVEFGNIMLPNNGILQSKLTGGTIKTLAQIGADNAYYYAGGLMAIDSSGDFHFASGSDLNVEGDVRLNDNKKVILGAGSNASIYYDGTNLQINPQVVGSGVTAFTGNIQKGNFIVSDNGATSQYQKVKINGGNSSGYIWGSWNGLDDGIHIGYNAYYINGVDWDIPNLGGATSRITCDYGNIKFYTGTINVAPTVERLKIDSAGTVFVSSGEIAVGQYNSTKGLISLNGDNTAFKGFHFYSGGSGLFTMGLQPNDPTNFRITHFGTGATRLSIDANGRVYVGANCRMYTSGNEAFIDGIGAGGLYIGNGNGGLLQLGITNSGYIYYEGAKHYFRTGKVGIGINPTYALDVSTTGAGYKGMFSDGTAELGLYVNNASDIGLWTTTNHPLRLGVNNGAHALEINTSSNIIVQNSMGLGTTPGWKLHVSQAGGPYEKLVVDNVAGAGNYCTILLRAGSPIETNTLKLSVTDYGDFLVQPSNSKTSMTCHVLPSTNNTYTLGNASFRWNEIFCTNGIINTSDVNTKEQIVTSDLGLDFINMLNPVRYKFTDYSETIEHKEQVKVNETYETKIVEEVVEHKFTRKHYGLIAQEVKSVLDTLNKTSLDFGGWCSDDINGVERQGLRYTEFIAPLIKAVQELSQQVATLTESNVALTERVALLEGSS